MNLLPGAPTRVWRFTGKVQRGPETALQVIPGSYLGPIIRLRRGQKVRIRFRNNLGEPSIVHWHGLDVPESADGHPRLAVADGRDYVYEFEVLNRAGTYWYHPHPHMRTGAQVYQGLAGLLVVSDEEEDALGLPSGRAELTLRAAGSPLRCEQPVRLRQPGRRRDGRWAAAGDVAWAWAAAWPR